MGAGEELKKAISGDLLAGEIKAGEVVAFRSGGSFIFATSAPPVGPARGYGFVCQVSFARRFVGER